MAYETNRQTQTEAESLFPGKLLSDYCKDVKYDDTVDNFLATLTTSAVLSSSLQPSREYAPEGTEVRYNLFYVLGRSKPLRSQPAAPVTDESSEKTEEAAPEPVRERPALRIATAADIDEDNPPKTFYEGIKPVRLELPVITDFPCAYPLGLSYKCHDRVQLDIARRYRDSAAVRELMSNVGWSVLRVASLAMSPLLAGVEYRFKREPEGKLTQIDSRIFYTRHMLATAGLVAKVVARQEATAKRNEEQVKIADWMRKAAKLDEQAWVAKNMATDMAISFLATQRL